MRTFLVLAALARVAHADDDDDARLAHAGAIAGMGALYLALDLGIDSPAACRWCSTNTLDRSLRTHWDHAEALGTITTYGLVPLATAGLVALSGDSTWRRAFDDLAPIVEAGAATSLVALGSKLAVARRRPDGSDNESFFSEQTSGAFALAVSSGVVATRRHYRLAPAIWASGLVLASASGYLRIASDQHWATDVAAGAVAGALVGLAWPTFVPTPSGIAAVGSF